MKYVIILAALLLAGPALSQISAQTDGRYTYIQADYIADGELEVLDFNEDGDGYGGILSTSISPHVLFGVEYHTLGNSHGDTDTFFVWLGLRMALAENLDLYGQAGYDDVELSIPAFFKGDTNGPGARIGLRWWPIDALELAAEIRLADYGDHDIRGATNVDIDYEGVSVNALYRISDSFALGVEYLDGTYEFEHLPVAGTVDLDRSDLRLNVRYYLQP